MGHTQVSKQERQQAAEGLVSVGHERDVHVFRQLRQQLIENGGFAGADLTDQGDEPAPIRETVLECVHRFAVLFPQVEVVRVRRQIEGLCREAEVGGVHDLPFRCAPRAPGSPGTRSSAPERCKSRAEPRTTVGSAALAPPRIWARSQCGQWCQTSHSCRSTPHMWSAVANSRRANQSKLSISGKARFSRYRTLPKKAGSRSTMATIPPLPA